jgi:hypothetical protein
MAVNDNKDAVEPNICERRSKILSNSSSTFPVLFIAGLMLNPIQ